jgi:prepilin-type N-terminal cleavage/methylation domain-containing protein
MDTTRSASSSGFTVVELLVVIAILAVLVGMLVPAVQVARHADNESEAARTLRQIAVAQEAFRAEDGDGDGAPDYAASIDELIHFGYIDGLGAGVKWGYQFEMVAGPGTTFPGGDTLFHWDAVGRAAVAQRSGILSFIADETGVILTAACPPGFQPFLVNGRVRCIPTPAPAGPLGHTMSVAVMDAANFISGGAALPAAKDALPALVDRILTEFDADGDLHVSYQEMLSADILAMARRIASVQGGETRVSAGLAADDLLRFILDRFMARLRQDAAVQPSEDPAPTVAVAAVGGHADTLTELVSPTVPFGSLSVVQGLIEGLDPDPAAAQMTSPHLATNVARKARLLDAAKAMPTLLRLQKVQKLEDSLLGIRARTDGVPAMDDWVRGESAAQITAQIDRTLALIGP